jgi:hypothetical protein
MRDMSRGTELGKTGNVVIERVQMDMSRGKMRKEERKRQEKGEEEGCMERDVHIGNKSWKIMTIYSKELSKIQ